MIELLIVSIISLFFLILLPRIRQSLDDLDKKYEEKNKWKQNIDKHYNGHHSQVNSFGYQDYKYDEC